VPAKRARRPTKRPARGRLPEALCNPACYGAGVDEVRLVETHVSWVFLTGQHAYKVKKPVKLPFVDFSTLRLREHYCREELRINRRLAPELYLAVVPIGGTSQAPLVGRKPAFEYAVKMREFPDGARLDRKVAANEVPRAAAAEFGARLAKFHGSLSPVRGVSAADVVRTAQRNVAELGDYLGREQRRELTRLRDWTAAQCARLEPIFKQRAAAGAHRECHGDLHLQNLLWRDGKIMAFDALEFDRKLRDIDVVSEIAFLAMDLHAQGRAALAHEFMNRYLEVGGDYAGIDVLRFYLVYRALVRAKVAAIKRAQAASDEHDRDRYLATALALAAPPRPALVITHGLSGSGKTFVTDELIGRLPALRARSDVERKRLLGLDAAARTGSGVGSGIYTAAAGRHTYAALAGIADRLLRDGHHAVIDAAFLRRAERLEFRQVAAANAAGFAILNCTAPVPELRRRVAARAQRARDASEADVTVLEQQLRSHDPLDAPERRSAVTVDTSRPIDFATLAARLRAH
jgi:aminoglycoside phosphotransferase family enzyme/predicted kinase